MNNFKNGSGDLDFGDDGSDSDGQDESVATDDHADETTSQSESGSTDTAENSPAGTSTSTRPPHTQQSSDYPYFVRRNNVMDERETRWELHIRDEVADQEPAFRETLAEQLNTETVSKTDAREFAVKYAFQHPEMVADLMEEEGYGITE